MTDQEKRIAELEQENEALDAKVKSLAPHGTCGCSYDKPGDLCGHHSPRIAQLEKMLDDHHDCVIEATASLKKENTELRRQLLTTKVTTTCPKCAEPMALDVPGAISELLRLKQEQLRDAVREFKIENLERAQAAKQVGDAIARDYDELHDVCRKDAAAEEREEILEIVRTPLDARHNYDWAIRPTLERIIEMGRLTARSSAINTGAS